MRAFLCALAFVLCGPAQAAIVTFEIGGTVECNSAQVVYGYCSFRGPHDDPTLNIDQMNPGTSAAWEAFAAATGLQLHSYSDYGWDHYAISGSFSDLIRIDTEATEPTNEDGAVIAFGTNIGATVRGPLGYSCENGLTQMMISGSLFGGTGWTNLCSESVLVRDWAEFAALSDAEIATFVAGFGEYDKYLLGDSWSGTVMWQAEYIRRIPAPGTLALLLPLLYLTARAARQRETARPSRMT
jgi:hypothetical protein